MQTRGSSKLTAEKRKALILGLCQALCVLKSPDEVADALTDLLSAKEIETIAKRLQIAEYLADGKDYSYIREKLRVGYSTIARVNTWLNISGEGYRIMLSRRKKSAVPLSEEDKYDPYSWHNIKRRYSMYYWPQLLMDELLKSSDRKQKEKMQEIFEKLKLKGRRFNAEENKILYEQFSSQIERKGEE